MSASSDNSLAASGARSALGDINSALYQWKVQRPWVTAQTEAQKQNALYTAQQTRAQELQNHLISLGIPEAEASAAALAAARKADSNGISVPPPPAGAPSPDVDVHTPSTAGKTDLNAAAVKQPSAMTPPDNTTTPKAAASTPSPSPISAAPLAEGESGGIPSGSFPDAMSGWAGLKALGKKIVGSFSPMPGLTGTTPAPLKRNVSVTRPGIGAGDSTKPATFEGPVPAAPKVSSPQSTSGAMNAGSTAGASEAALPPVTPPVASAAPTPAPARAGMNVQLFQDLEPAQQAEVLAQMRGTVPPGVTVGDHDLVAAYNANQMKALTLNPALMRGMTPIKAGPGGIEWVNRDLMGGAGGRPQPYIMKPDGTVGDNPDYLKAPDLAGHIADLGNLQEAQSVLNDARTVVNTNPEAYGQALSKGAPGTEIGRIITRTKAMLGSPKDYSDQRKLDMQNLAGMLNKLSTIHIGRVTEMEWSALANSIPKLTDDEKTWNNWLGRVQNTLDYAMSAKEGLLAPYLGDENGQQLGNVSIPSRIGAPASGGPKQYSPKEAQGLSPGTVYEGTDGKHYRR
jgi:hypothetical protein